jgi:hypothetical protein
MNKALLTLIVAPVFLITATFTHADESIKASAETVKEYTEMCVNWAKDDQVISEEIYAYVLQCVNDELESEGYQAVSSVKI